MPPDADATTVELTGWPGSARHGAGPALPSPGGLVPALDSLQGLVAAWLLGYSSEHTRRAYPVTSAVGSRSAPSTTSIR